MVNYNYFSRSSVEENPQESKYILDKLCKHDITFEPKVFEYRGPNDFIFYGYQGDEITFAIKALCSELHIKFVSIYYNNQADIFLGLYNLRLMVAKGAEVQIEKGGTLTIIWSAEICSETVKNYARLTNTMDSDNLEHKMVKANKHLYFGKNIEIKETSGGFTQSVPPLTNTVFQPNNTNTVTNTVFQPNNTNTATNTVFQPNNTNTNSLFPTNTNTATNTVFPSTNTNTNSLFPTNTNTNSLFPQNKGFGNTQKNYFSTGFK